MRRSITTILFILFFYSASLSQEANNWYFGDHAGLSFTTSPPTALLDGQMNTAEGCSGISDSLGHLLFYTDGVNVWNKNHQVMPNGTGLMGNTDTTSLLRDPEPGKLLLFCYV